MKRVIQQLTQRLAGVVFFASTALYVRACPECRAQVDSGVYSEDFAATLLSLLLPIIVLALVGVGIHYAGDIKAKLRGRLSEWQTTSNARP